MNKLLNPLLLIFASSVMLYAVEDSFESNDTRATAASLSFGTHNLHCANDDWFAITVSSPGTVFVQMSHPNVPTGDINCLLKNSDGATVKANITSATETFTYHAIATGTYYIHVMKADPGNVNNDYTLTVSRSVSSSGDDDSEENDNFGEATTLQLNNALGSRICHDEDWYGFTSSGSGEVTVVTLFNGNSENVDLEVYDESMNRVAYSVNAVHGGPTSSGRSLTFTPSGNQTYRIVAFQETVRLIRLRFSSL